MQEARDNEEPTLSVFVYGTLMKGMPNEHFLTETNSVLIGPTFIEGAMMIAIGDGFPAVMRTEEPSDIVIGEHWLINHETQSRIDRLEGVRIDERGEDRGMYRREMIALGDKSGNAAVYIWNKHPANRTIVISGSWRQYRDDITHTDWETDSQYEDEQAEHHQEQADMLHDSLTNR